MPLGPLHYQTLRFRWVECQSTSLQSYPSSEVLLNKVLGSYCFTTWVKLHDMDQHWATRIDFRRQLNEIATPIYYAVVVRT